LRDRQKKERKKEGKCVYLKEHEPTINNHALAFREIFFLTNVVTYVVDSSVGVFIWTGRKEGLSN
jgi:hypothetical protein